MKNVLVTGVGGPTPRSFVRALQFASDANLAACRFIGIDCNPLAYGLYSRDLFSATYMIPPVGDPDYWPAIKRIIAKEDIHAAIVMPEVEVIEWSSNLQQIPAHVKTHLPNAKLATILVDKLQLHQALDGTPWVPRFQLIDPARVPYAELLRQFDGSFWMRSTTGSSGLGSLCITDEPTYANWLAMNSQIETFIATEFLPGRNLACKLLYFDNRLLRTACAERVTYIMSKVAPSGITGNTAFGRLINSPTMVQVAENAMQHIASTLDVPINGIFTVDFKEDAAGNPKITEINVRHVAFTQVLAAAGANIPADTLNLMALNDYRNVLRLDYCFKDDWVFLRDVDEKPILLRESELLGSLK